MTDSPLLDFANVNGGPILMNGPYNQNFLMIGGPLNGTYQKVPLDMVEGIPRAPTIYRVGKIPALGSPGSIDAHFVVYSYRRCESKRRGIHYVFEGPRIFPDEQPDPEVMRFYERFEALVYIGAIVVGVAIVAGLWFWVNGG